MKLLNICILVVCFFSCISRKKNNAGKAQYFEKSGTLISIQSDWYFADTLLNSANDLPDFLDSGTIILNKLVLIIDTSMNLLNRSEMFRFLKDFHECGIIDSLHEVKYMNVRVVLKNNSPFDIYDYEIHEKINKLCIYILSYTDTTIAHYWKFRNNMKYILVNVLPLK
jgi:hypothetical protein